jgi:hypothetical protein
MIKFSRKMVIARHGSATHQCSSMCVRQGFF